MLARTWRHRSPPTWRGDEKWGRGCGNVWRLLEKLTQSDPGTQQSHFYVPTQEKSKSMFTQKLATYNSREKGRNNSNGYQQVHGEPRGSAPRTPWGVAQPDRERSPDTCYNVDEPRRTTRSGRSWLQKATYCMIPFLGHVHSDRK